MHLAKKRRTLIGNGEEENIKPKSGNRELLPKLSIEADPSARSAVRRDGTHQH